MARAEQLYRLALATRPKYAPALANLGMVVFESQRREEGYALLMHAVEADPALAGAHCSLGIVLALADKLELARQQFEIALKLDVQNETYANLAPIWQQTCDRAALERFIAELAESSARAPGPRRRFRVRMSAAAIAPGRMPAAARMSDRGAGDAGRERGAVDAAGELRDFSATAEAMATTDMVVSVATAVAHLAGAMGKPSCLLLNQPAAVRWTLAREDTPGYPSMRLLRKTGSAPWGDLLVQAKTAIREICSD